MNFSEQEKKIIFNSLIAYADIICAISLGCKVPKKFEKLSQLSDEELNNQKEIIALLLKQFDF